MKTTVGRGLPTETIDDERPARNIPMNPVVLSVLEEIASTRKESIAPQSHMIMEVVTVGG